MSKNKNKKEEGFVGAAEVSPPIGISTKRLAEEQFNNIRRWNDKKKEFQRYPIPERKGFQKAK